MSEENKLIQFAEKRGLRKPANLGEAIAQFNNLVEKRVAEVMQTIILGFNDGEHTVIFSAVECRGHGWADPNVEVVVAKATAAVPGLIRDYYLEVDLDHLGIEEEPEPKFKGELRQSGISRGTCMEALGHAIANAGTIVRLGFDPGCDSKIIDSTMMILEELIEKCGTIGPLQGIVVRRVTSALFYQIEIESTFYGHYKPVDGPSEYATPEQYHELRKFVSCQPSITDFVIPEVLVNP